MSEEKAPYLVSPFNQPADPSVVAEFRQARRDFTYQVGRAVEAERSAAKLEKRVAELEEAARETLRTVGNFNCTDKSKRHETHLALQRLGSLVDYPGWYEL